MAEQFGKTWWGQQWLQALNNIDHGNRLPRGTSYARKGAVTQIKIDQNLIEAKVQGSRKVPYKITIILPPFFDPQLSNFLNELVGKPLLISKLFNRELDPELLSTAEKSGLKVFPKQWTDIKMQCSCPDWAVPCKHLAAVIYKISSEIDNNPFLAFQLHRLDLIGELTQRGLFIHTNPVEIPQLVDFYFDKAEKKKQVLPEFDNLKAYQKLSFTTLTSIQEALYTLLADNPVFYNQTGNFKEKYQIHLNQIIRNAQRIIKGKMDLAEVLNRAKNEAAQVNHYATNRVYIDEQLKAKVLVNDVSFSPLAFMLELSNIPVSKTLDYQPSTASLHSVFYLALHLVVNGAVVPQIVVLPNKNYAIRWLPALISKDVQMLLEKLSDMLPPDIFYWQTSKTEKRVEKDLAINLLSVFLTHLMNALTGKNINDFFEQFFFKQLENPFRNPGESALAGGVQTWLQKYYLNQGVYKPQIVVSETINDEFLIELNILNLSENNVPLFDVLNLKKYDKQRLEILQTIATIIDFVPGLEAFVQSKGEKAMVMDTGRFTPFLFQMIPVIKLLEIDILLPKSLKEIIKPKVSMRMKSKQGKSFIRLDQLLDFDWQISLGDTLVSESEFKKMLQNSDGLLKYKSQYIYVGKEDLEKLHKHFTSDKETPTQFELLRTALTGDYKGAKVTLDQEVIDLIKALTEITEVPLPKGINAQLRPYQLRGYAWMYRNAKIGFGSVIADDMGLGKTLQVIATLLKFKEDGLLGEKKLLVITPTGLLTNWLSEIEKFAPSLKAALFHGTNRKIPAEYDLLLTSYGIARSDAAKLKKMPWYSVVIDEAQNIKNQDTAQAKAIRTIGAANFIAMSGTPVENRLSELWSIMDYSNRGVLGNVKEFQENFASPIEVFNDAEVAEKLKKASAPFLMRRLKSDKSIISDLPDKIEMDCYGTLVPEQASLYEKTLEEALKEIEAIDPTDKKELFVRQGLVLQMILALKQICNHPTQYLKNNNKDASLSGKLELLFSKLDAIVSSGEKVLIFTQFKEMGNLLQYFIEERYKEKPMFYHGGSSLPQRNQMVENFQTNPAYKIFILSLKAAGTGLNLTAANHVIHYDLWWNPAVENQATDRAYRIGQKSNVMVHRFITKNTFEERINEMISSKKALAEMTVSTGENWIGNLSNTELKAIFQIGK